MDDSERLNSLRLFIGALTRVLGSQKEVPFDPVSFAKVVADAQGEGNEFARRFAVYTTIAGKLCPDFQEGLTLAQSAGLISRQNPSYTQFSLRMPLRQVRRLEEDGIFEAAEQLAERYTERLGLKSTTHATA